MELTKQHFALVKDEEGTYTEKKASEVEVGDVPADPSVGAVLDLYSHDAARDHFKDIGVNRGTSRQENGDAVFARKKGLLPTRSLTSWK